MLPWNAAWSEGSALEDDWRSQDGGDEELRIWVWAEVL